MKKSYLSSVPLRYLLPVRVLACHILRIMEICRSVMNLMRSHYNDSDCGKVSFIKHL